MENAEFFDAADLHIFKDEKEVFLSLDVRNFQDKYLINIFENKSCKGHKIPNTLEDIWKKFSYENKIKKYLDGNQRFMHEFIYKIKYEKKGIFEYSVSLKIN